MIGHEWPVSERPGGDRRAERRYELRLDVAWKLVHRNRVVAAGTGRTRDLSSHGILFEAAPAVVAGKNVELSIRWPVLLHGVAPIRLVVTGHVVRCEGRLAAVHIKRYEFRTARRSGDPPAASLQALAVRSV